MGIDPRQYNREAAAFTKNMVSCFCVHAPDPLLPPASAHKTETDAPEGAAAAAAAATRWFSFTVQIQMLSCIDLSTHQFSHFLHPPLRSPLQHLWITLFLMTLTAPLSINTAHSARMSGPLWAQYSEHIIRSVWVKSLCQCKPAGSQ